MSAAVSPADPSPAPVTRGETVDKDNPWPGLAAFGENDAAFFHGREAETLDLFLLVRREVLTVFFGISGLGKTSLLFAGVFPRLKAESFLPVYVRINHDERAPTPLVQVLDAIRRAAGKSAIEVPSADDVESLWEYFHRDDALLWSKHNEIVTPVLVFDQFEECFVDGRNTLAREARTSDLFTQIADLVENRPPERVRRQLDEDPAAAQRFDFVRHRYRVVISLRKDYLADLDELREQIPSIANRYGLKRMTAEVARDEVVCKPGLVADDGTAEAIVRYVAATSSPQQQLDGEGGPPLDKLYVEPALLSLFCRELNEARKEAHEPRISKALFLSNRQEILKGFYQRCMRGRSAKVWMFVEDELLTQSGARKSAALEDIQHTYGDIEPDIRELINFRLLRREERDGLEWIELTHDRLTGVVRESRDRRHDQEEIERAREQARQEQLRRKEAEQREEDAKQRQKDAEQREEVKRRQLTATRITFAAVVSVIVAVVAGVIAARQQVAATREHALANYQNGLLRFQEGRTRSGLAYLARGLGLDDGCLVRWFGDQREAVSFSTAVFAGLWYTEWPLRTLSDSAGFNGAVLSGDGSRVLTIAADVSGGAHLWDARSGRQTKDSVTYGQDVVAAFLSHDGSAFVTSSSDGGIQWWDPSRDEPVRQLSLGQGVFRCGSFNGDGTSLVMASLDGRDPARVWQSSGDRTVLLDTGNDTTRPGRAICPVGISADGSRVVTGWSDGGVQLWDVSTGARVGEPLQRRWQVTAVALSADGARVMMGSSDGKVRLSDYQEEKEGHQGKVTSAMFSPGGDRIVTASADGTAQVWVVDKRSLLPAGPPLRHEDSVWSAAFDAGGTHIATASRDGTVQIWDARPGAATGRLLGNRETSVKWAAFSPGGDRVASVGGDGSVRLYALPSGTEIHPSKRDGTGTVYTAAFSPDGALLVTGSDDCTVRLWNGRTGDFIRTVGSHEAAGDASCSVSSVAFDAQGQHIVTASDDGEALLWDVRSDKTIGEPMKHTGAVPFAGFAYDGRVVTAAGKEIRAWDPEKKDSYTVLLVLDVEILGASISLDGRRVAVALNDCSAGVVDLEKKSMVGARFLHPGDRRNCAVQWAALSSAGDFVVTAHNNSARLWDVRTGALLGAPLLHENTVWGAAFSLDDTRVVTASDDGTAKIWDVASPAVRLNDLVALATAVAGADVDESDVSRMSPDRDDALAKLRDSATATTDQPTPYVALLRRFFDRAQRSDAPTQP